MQIVNDHGVELKAKATPLIGYVMFGFEFVTDGISGPMTLIKLWHHVNVYFN